MEKYFMIIFGVSTFVLIIALVNTIKDLSKEKKFSKEVSDNESDLRSKNRELERETDNLNTDKLNLKRDNHIMLNALETKVEEIAKNIRKQDVYDDIKREVGDNLTLIMAKNPNFQLPFDTCANISHYLNNNKVKSDLLLDYLNDAVYSTDMSGGRYMNYNFSKYKKLSKEEL